MIIGLVSAKGSPGVTSTALVLTSVGGDGALIVELDPSGGSIECWSGVASEPGLTRVASGLRRSIDPGAVTAGVRQVPRGISVVHAPISGSIAEPTIAAIGERLTMAMAGYDPLVVIDAGRWCRSQSTARRISGCDVIAIVCQPTVAGVEAARSLIDPIEAVTGVQPVFLLIGDRPYTADEVSAATGIGVLGSLPWEPRSLNALLPGGTFRGWSRYSIARSANTLLHTLTKQTAQAAKVGVAL